MPRLDLLGDDDVAAGARKVFAEIEASGSAVPDVYRLVAHSPELVRAWKEFAWPMRAAVTAPVAIRELAILRVAHLVSSDRQWRHHSQLASAAGVSDDKLSGLRGGGDDPAFTAPERATLRLVDEMTVDVHVDEQTFASVLSCFGPAATVELTLLIAYYRCLAGLLAAFDLQ